MSNAKKILDGKGERAPRAQRTPRLKFDMASAADAVVDGKLTVPVGSKIVVSRVRSKRQMLCVCEIKKVEDDGLIHAWDETLTQWFLFRVTDNVGAKVMFIASAPQET